MAIEVRATRVATAATSGATVNAVRALGSSSARAPAVTTLTTLLGNLTPVTATDPDVVSIELGMRFQSSVATQVVGVRFWKGGATNSGTHTATLWSATGTSLAFVTFSGETTSGWQTATFSSPISIAANTDYVISYLAPAGRYSSTSGGFASPVTNGTLTAGVGAGLYKYGSGFPTSTFGNTNYFVDVIAVAQPPTAPAVMWQQSPPSGVCPAPAGSMYGTDSFDAAILATNELWDNFDGTTLDSRLWVKDTINQLGAQTYNPANVFLDGTGNLVFEARTDNTSGRLTSRTKFNMQYGWLAARIKMPSDPGFFPAWWLLYSGYNTAPSMYGEIDMLEFFGAATHYDQHLHFGGSNEQLAAGADVPTSHGDNASLSYHTYWMLWEPDRIQIGVDDLSIVTWTAASLTNPGLWSHMQQPFYYIWNFALGPIAPWLPAPSAGSRPARMSTDWIWYKPLNLL